MCLALVFDSAGLLLPVLRGTEHLLFLTSLKVGEVFPFLLAERR